MTALSLRLPWQFLRANALRLALTILAIACGVALVCATDLVNRAVYAAFADAMDATTGRAALQIHAEGDALLPEDLVGTIATVPGVELAVPVVSALAFPTDGSGDVLAVQGVDVTNDAAVRIYEPSGGGSIADTLVFLSQPDSIVITDEFARRRHLAVDDALELNTPTGRKRFVVRGLLSPTGVARVLGGNLIVMDIAAAEQTFTRPRFVNRVDVVVSRNARVSDVTDAIKAALPSGLRVEAPEQRKLDLQAVMQSSQLLLNGVSLLGLLAAFFIAFSRLTTHFEARTWAHAVLRAVGVRQRRVWWELAKESLLLGSAAVLVGAPLGIGLGHALLPIIARATLLGSNLPMTATTLSVRPVSLALAALLGLGSALAAAALPARRASRMPVPQALAHRGTELPGSDSVWLARLRLGVCGGAVLLLALHVITGSGPLGLLATVSLVVAVAALVRPLLGALMPHVMRVTTLLGGSTGQLGVDTLFRNPRRTSLAVSMLAVSLGAVLWLWTVASSFERSVVELLPGKLRGDLSVTSADVAGYVETPVHQSMLEALTAVQGVDVVVGEQVATWRYQDGPIALDAYDPAYFTDPRYSGWRLVGRQLPGALEAVARGDGAIVSENFAHNLNVRPGDEVALDTPTGPLRLRVVALITDFISPRGTITLSRALYASRWQDQRIVRGLVKVAAGESPEAVGDRIRHDLAARFAVRVFTIGQLVEWFGAQVRQAFDALRVLAALVLVVVLVGVGDTLTAGMLERTRELGLVRAIGVRRRVVGRAVLVEGLILCLFGLVLAWVIGLGLGVLWVEATFPALVGWTLALHVPLEPVAGVAVAGLVVCLLAAYLPAAHAARLDPAAALRAE